MERRAYMSKCGLHRYTLERIWDPALPLFVVLGLNPSDADAEKDDPTNKRCVAFAKREGCGSLLMLNPYTLRTPKPDKLFEAPEGERAGPENVDVHRTRLVLPFQQGHPHKPPAIVVAAWGADKRAKDMTRSYAAWLWGNGVHLKCFQRNKDGSPRHPLYVRGDRPLEDFD